MGCNTGFSVFCIHLGVNAFLRKFCGERTYAGLCGVCLTAKTHLAGWEAM